MSIKQSIQHNLLDNPIVRLEVSTLKRQSGKWLVWLPYVLTILVMLIPVFWGFSSDFYNSITVTLSLLVIANAIIYVIVVLKAIGTANDSTYRERRGKTWELLMLTGVSNWRMVFGKWLGVMRHLIRDFAWLYLLRAGTFLWYVAQMNLQRDYDYNCFYGYSNYCSVGRITLAHANFGHEFLFHALLLTLAFTILELMASTAIGMSTAFFNWKSRTATGAAMLIRIALGVGLPLLVFFTLFQIERNQPGWVSRTFSDEMAFFGTRLLTVFADNGMIGASFLVSSNGYPSYMQDYYTIYWASNWVSLGLYGLVTILALQMAATRAFFGGVSLSTGDIIEGKSKRKIDAAPYPRPLPDSQARPNRIYAEHGQGNVFGLQGANLRLMEVYHYQRRLGRMILRVTGEGEPVYIQLENVAYMEAPAFWKGASLNTATESEYRIFINDKKIAISGFAEDTMRLYWNDAGVRIVAGSAEYLDELPATM
jgi:hypothetical protein